MLSRLKQTAKKAIAFIVASIVVLTALPAVPAKAAEVLNYHLYQNAKQVYDSIPHKGNIYTTPDNAELFWVTKSNKAKRSTNRRYRTLGWRFYVTGNGSSVKCEFKLGNSISKPMGDTYESDGYYYILYAVDLTKVYNYVYSRDSRSANEIYKGDSYRIKAYPIMSIVPANEDNPKGEIKETGNGLVSVTKAPVYFMDNEADHQALANKGWSSSSYTAFDDFHNGRRCDIDTMAYSIKYRIVKPDGAAVKNTPLSNGLKTAPSGGVTDSSGHPYSNPVKSYAPTNALNTSLNITGYTLSDYWKRGNYAVKKGGQITSYAISGYADANKSVTLTAVATPNTYYVDYYKDEEFIMRQACTYDSDYKIKDGSSITWNGYTFKNWKQKDSNVIYNSNQGFKNLSSENGAVIKLYAQKEPKEYEVTFNKTGGQGGTDRIYEKYATRYTAQSEKVQGSDLTPISTVTSPLKYGYDFAGYYTSTNGYGIQFTQKGAQMLTPNRSQTVGITDNTKQLFDDTNSHVVYANYVPRTPNIHFDKQGGNDGTNDVTAVFDQNLPSEEDNNGTALSCPDRTGWSFKGYYTEPGGKGNMLYNESMGPVGTCYFEDDITVYAYWVDDILPTVTAKAFNGWTNQPVTVTIRMQDKGSGLDASECKVTMDGKEIGWNKAFSDGAITEITTTPVCSTEGIHIFEATATDMWGNVSSAMTVVYYDITAPKGSVHAYGPGVSERIPMTYLNNSSVWYIRDGKVTDYNVKYD